MRANENTFISFNRGNRHLLKGIEFEGVYSRRRISELMTFQGSIFPIRRGKHSRMAVLPSTSSLTRPISGRAPGLRFRRFTLFLMMILASVGRSEERRV